MSRSKWKGPFVKSSLISYQEKSKKVKNIKIWSRNSIIPFSIVGQQVSIHNGKDFIKIKITREKVGYRFGEFSFTRRHRIKTKVKAKKGKNEKSNKK